MSRRKGGVPKLYCIGYAYCYSCGYQWDAVWELGCNLLHCPECEKDSTERTIQKRVDEDEIEIYNKCIN